MKSDSTYDSYVRFLSFWIEYIEKNKDNVSADTSLETAYCHFFSHVKEVPGSQIFIEFFDHLMISICSGAIAERVGSIMSIVMKRGRKTNPVNFEKEIKLRFSLHIK